jgi:hypothetical protein
LKIRDAGKVKTEALDPLLLLTIAMFNRFAEFLEQISAKKVKNIVLLQ